MRVGSKAKMKFSHFCFWTDFTIKPPPSPPYSLIWARDDSKRFGGVCGRNAQYIRVRRKDANRYKKERNNPYFHMSWSSNVRKGDTRGKNCKTKICGESPLKILYFIKVFFKNPYYWVKAKNASVLCIFGDAFAFNFPDAHFFHILYLKNYLPNLLTH